MHDGKKKVVAVYDYTKVEEEDITLVKVSIVIRPHASQNEYTVI